MSDITINRNKGNAASKIANDVVEPTKRATRERVLEYVCNHHGVTSKDVQDHLRKMVYHPDNWPPNAFSGRLSKLKADGFIAVLPTLRDGLQVFVKAEAQMSLLEAR